MEKFIKYFAWCMFGLIMLGFLIGIAHAINISYCNWEVLQNCDPNKPKSCELKSVSSWISTYISSVSAILAISFGAFLGFSLTNTEDKTTYRISRLFDPTPHIALNRSEDGDDETDIRRQFQATAAITYFLGIFAAAIAWFYINRMQPSEAVSPILTELSHSVLPVIGAFLTAYLLEQDNSTNIAPPTKPETAAPL